MARNDGISRAIRPLTREHRDGSGIYTREARAENEISILLHYYPRERRERLLSDGGRKTDTSLTEETLVYFIREYARHGDEIIAWEIMEILVARTQGRFAREAAQWKLTPADTEDCWGELVQVLYEAVRDTSPQSEFWEVRFWLCLGRRMTNLLKRYASIASHELGESASIRDGDEGEMASIFATFADPGISPDEMAEKKALLASLTPMERTVLMLLYGEGLPEESDDPTRQTVARTLGVTGRTVRNHLKRIRGKMAGWDQGES